MVHFICIPLLASYNPHPSHFNICVSFTLSTVPPRIETFSFREGLSEGMRTRVVCGVYQGEEPLTLTWLQADRSLQMTDLPGIQVKAIDHFSSVLILGPLLAEHSGRYTCRASNAAATIEAGAELIVNGKVKVKLTGRRKRPPRRQTKHFFTLV